MYVATKEELDNAILDIGVDLLGPNGPSLKSSVGRLGKVITDTSAHTTNHTFVELVKSAESDEEAAQILDTILIVGYNLREKIAEQREENFGF